MTTRTVAVVGGGPAGLAAAIHAARTGAVVTIHERNSDCGRKLLATGGGHCNLTNTLPAAEWPERFGRQGRFIVPALRRLSREALCDWFSAMGQPLHAPDGFHLFPVSNSAKRVRDALTAQAEKLGVAIYPRSRIVRIHTENGQVAALEDEAGRHPCTRVVLATGGRSWPATGSTWDGCRMAKRLGHTVRPAFPGLVGLRADNLDPALAGLVLPRARVILKERGKKAAEDEGELLLTHTGVSGPAVLDLSASVTQALAAGKGFDLRLQWRAGDDRAVWLERFSLWRRTKGSAPLASVLREYLPHRLARWLCGFSGVEDATGASSLPAQGRDRLAEALGGFPLAVRDSEGWDKAMITRGGVDIREVKPETLESRLASGLFFAGEVLDMDGPCGGYNLHWALASGTLAGTAAAAG